ncbi:MAG: metallophosphoesterase family protein, partial [bacterium]
RILRMPEEVWDVAGDVDIIVHAGDYTNMDTVEEIRGLGKVFYGVCGNMDDEPVKRELPPRLEFELNGIRFALVHGRGSPWGLAQKLYAELPKEKPDILIFGHSHIPLEEKYNKTLLLNPGSVSGNLFSSCGSYIIMEVDEKGSFRYNMFEFKV